MTSIPWRAVPPRRWAWVMWWCALVAACGLVAGALAGAWHWRGARAEAEQGTQAAMGEMQRVKPGAKGDFVGRLPVGTGEATVLKMLYDLADEHGVKVVSVQVAPKPATPQSLGRLELGVTLKGGYVATTTVLSALAARYQGGTWPQLRMRKSESAGDVETSFVINLWSAPQASLPSR